MLYAKSNLIKDLDGKVYKLDQLYLGNKVEATPEEVAKYDMLPLAGFINLGDNKVVSEVELILSAGGGSNSGGSGNTGGGSSGGSIDSESLAQYLHKLRDKATYEDITLGELDSKYVTPQKLQEYLRNLVVGSGINVFTVNGKSGAVVIDREDLELENVLNVEQASKEEFNEHIEDYEDAHITWAEKRNIYDLISKAYVDNTKALLKESKATIEDVEEGESDELYLTSKAFGEMLRRQFGAPQDLTTTTVTSINGKTGNVLITREDIELEKVLNKEQATKTEFESHLSEMENYHVSAEWRSMILGRIIALENKITKMLEKTMKASTELAIEGTDDATYMTPKLIKEVVENTINNLTQEDI